jgi:hypothetical protein
MKAVVITPAYRHTHRWLEAAVRKSGLDWLPLYEHSDLPRVRSILITEALRKGADRVILCDADTVPLDGALEAFVESTAIAPKGVALWGLYPLRDGKRWNVEPKDAVAALEAIRGGKRFAIRSGGLGLCCIHRASLERVAETLPTVTEATGASWAPFCVPFVRGSEYFGDDGSLCARLEETGTPLVCDPKIRAGHVASVMFTEIQS